MPRPAPSAQKPSAIYRQNKGGLNVREPQQLIADGEATLANNCYFDTSGAIKKRGGWSKVTAAAVTFLNSNICGIYHAAFVVTGVIQRFIVVTDGFKVGALISGGWSEITGAMSLSVTSQMLVTFVQMNNLLISVDGVNEPWKWTGTGNIAALGGTPPIGNISIVWSNYLFWAGVSTNQNRLYYSALADPETYPATNYIDIPNSFDGDPITGLAIFYGDLIIFKRNSIYILQGTGPTNWVLSKNNSSLGCVSPYSVVPINNLVYFCSDKGLYAFNVFNLRQEAYKVEPRYMLAVQNQLQGGTLFRNRLQAVHFRPRSQIWVAIDATAGGQDKHDRIMVHDYVNVDDKGDPAVSEYSWNTTPSAPAVFAEYVSSGGVITPIASFYDQYVYYYDESATTDAGTAIVMEYDTKYFSWDDAFSFKSVRFFHSSGSFAGGAPKIKITASNNIGTTSTSATYAPSSGTFWNGKGSIPSSVISMAKYFKFGFISDDGGAFTLYEYGFDVIVKGRRQ